jgi:hypothetical protein
MMIHQMALFFVVGGVICALVGVNFAIKVVPLWRRDRKLMQHGIEAQAQVIKQTTWSSGISRETAGGGWIVTYRFEVPGGSGPVEKEEKINNILISRKLVEGAAAAIRFLPSDPVNTATLVDNIHFQERQKEFRRDVLFTLACGLISLVSLVILLNT